MNGISDETVVAYVDGRLDPVESAGFEALLREDAGLADRVAAHRWMARQVVAAYPDVPDEVEAGELAMQFGLAEPKVVPLSMFGPRVKVSRKAWIPVAMAASLMVGLFAGSINSEREDPHLALRDGRAVAGGLLAQSLSSKLSGETGSIRVAMTIRTRRALCRVFQTDRGVSGLACREGGSWVVPIIETMQPDSEQSGEYRLAASAIAPEVMTHVDRSMEGEALGLAEETRLRKSGW